MYQGTRRLLTCGVAAGPLFLAIWALQAFTRDGFDPAKHPISLLALGGAGWIQIANFIVTGGLVVAGAVGLKRVLSGRWSKWGPLLVGGFGIGLILAGVFVTDPGAGFPTGAPERGEVSWHGILHEVGFGVAQLSWTAAAIVFARRFSGTGRWACVATITAAFLVAGWPDLDSLSMRLVVATALQFGLLAVVFGQLRRVETAVTSASTVVGDSGRKR